MNANATAPESGFGKDKTWLWVFIFSFTALLVDGMDLMFLSYTLTSLKNAFKLTEFQAGTFGTITLSGMAIGGIIGGWASDKYGRVNALCATILVFSVGTACLGFTQSYTQFAIVRGISSLGIGSLYVVANTLMSEYVPTKYRTTVLGTLQAGWSVGYVVASLLAGWIIPEYGWRYLYFIAIAPVPMVFAIKGMVPEPPSWRAAKAAAAAKAAEQVAAGVTVEKKESTWKLIFADPASKKMFLLWAATTGFLQFGYFGVNNWLPRYIEKEMGINFKSMAGYLALSYTAMIFGKIVAGMMADKFGRRAIYAFGGFSAALFIPYIVYNHSPDNILILLTIFGFLYGIPYGVGATYMTESFSTTVRGTAVGGSYNVGRVGAAIAPACIGYIATHWSIGLGFVVMGGAYFICGLIPALFIKDKQFDPQSAK